MEKAHIDFQKNFSVEAARKLAIELGAKLAIGTKDDLAENGEVKKELEKEFTETQKLAA